MKKVKILIYQGKVIPEFGDEDIILLKDNSDPFRNIIVKVGNHDLIPDLRYLFDQEMSQSVTDLEFEFGSGLDTLKSELQKKFKVNFTTIVALQDYFDEDRCYGKISVFQIGNVLPQSIMSLS